MSPGEVFYGAKRLSYREFKELVFHGEPPNFAPDERMVILPEQPSKCAAALFAFGLVFGGRGCKINLDGSY